LYGDFSSHDIHIDSNRPKHSDGHGGVLDLKGNKTLLVRHHFVGQKKQHAENNNAKYYESKNDNKNSNSPLPLARGVSGLPWEKTPALVGAQHGSIQCPLADGKSENMDELAYWNEPQGESDISFVSPFVPSADEPKEKRYVTFEPDRGRGDKIIM